MTATDVKNLYGFALDLVYDDSVLEFVDFRQLGFPRCRRHRGRLQVAEGAGWRLVIGQSRLGKASGVSGSGDLLLLIFKVVADGTTSIDPESTAAFNKKGKELAVTFPRR